MSHKLEKLLDAYRDAAVMHFRVQRDDDLDDKWTEREQAARAAIVAYVEGLTERRFPIQGGPSIPWSYIEPYEGQALLNHGQSLETLASRGGLSPVEAWCVLYNKDLSEYRNVSPENARQYLANLNRKFGELRELSVLRREVEELRGAIRGLLVMAAEAAEKRNGDWACRECRPHSEMLKEGFQCSYHAALRLVSQEPAL